MEIPPPPYPVRLNHREKLAGCVLLVIGLNFLVQHVYAWYFAANYLPRGLLEALLGTVEYIAYVLSAMLAITGAVLLFKRKRSGWIISVSLLSNLTVGWILTQVDEDNSGDLFSNIIWFIGLVFLLVSFLCLIQPEALAKFKINKAAWWAALVLFLVLQGIYLL